MNATEFSIISHTIPTAPGIYKYFDVSGELIYVGKAKHLRKRISSYFIKNQQNQKTIELVKRIHKIEFTIVDNEEDALFLENNLIKEYQPHYNINLKDDKTYPYVAIKKEYFPRVFFIRKKPKDGSQLFGPYTSTANAREILAFVQQYFPIRTCTLNLHPKNIEKKKYKVCLEYHLGNCKGPCEGFQSLEEYDQGIEMLKSMLKGNLTPLMQQLKLEMSAYAERLEFEKAELVFKKIESLKNYKVKSAVVDTRTGNLDVFSILEEGNSAWVNYLAVNEGSIIHTKTISLEKKLDETKEEILSLAITELRNLFKSEAKEILLPFPLAYATDKIKITIPKSGDKKKLLELSLKNVAYFRSELERKKTLRLEDSEMGKALEVLKEMQKYLQLEHLPNHIECFDNSNIQGSNPVAAMVCFKNGIPSKNDYRRFNIKTVTGINDFASMKEIVYRRYLRLKQDNLPLPDLIIIDGGKGQLGAALESIDELGLRGKVTLVGLAKNKEELFFPGDKESLLLPWDSNSLKLIRTIRDEVHRFGITFHRQKRSNAALENELEKIEGIGKATVEKLLKKFKSVKKIKEAKIEEIAAVIGSAKASLVMKNISDQ